MRRDQKAELHVTDCMRKVGFCVIWFTPSQGSYASDGPIVGEGDWAKYVLIFHIVRMDT